MDVRGRYRATGADGPFQDPRPAHPGVAMEGYFWRVTDPLTGRVVIVLIGVNQGREGPWATVGVASSDGFLRTLEVPGAWAAGRRLGAGVSAPGVRLDGSETRLEVEIDDGLGGPGAVSVALDVDPLSRWPRRSFGGSSIFQSVPGLNQYWHPWLLAGRASGAVRLGGTSWSFAGAHVYGEKNWGAEGFPEAWWWGQAHGFAEPGATLAFAGGQIHSSVLGMPLRTEVTALVARLPGGRVVRLGDPGLTPVKAEVSDDRWLLHGVDRLGGWDIRVDARAPLDRAHVLPVPLPSEHRNTPGALEHLSGAVEVQVRRRGRAVWHGRSSLAGLEHGGLARAEAELARRGGDPRPPALRHTH